MRSAQLIVLGTLVLVGACAKDNPPPDPRVASALAANDPFETAQDPPITAGTHFAAGYLAETQNNIPGAMDQYSKAIKTDAKHKASLYRLGVLYTQVKKYPEALTVWRAYAKLTDENPTALANLGFCYELSGDLDRAQTAYQMGIAKDPHHRLCRINYGLMLARTGRIEEATGQLTAVLSKAEVHYNIGSVHEQQGNKEQAKGEYQKALEIDPRFSDAQKRLAAMSSQ